MDQQTRNSYDTQYKAAYSYCVHTFIIAILDYGEMCEINNCVVSGNVAHKYCNKNSKCKFLFL